VSKASPIRKASRGLVSAAGFAASSRPLGTVTCFRAIAFFAEVLCDWDASRARVEGDEP
jgi:hypothetical protein